MVKILVDAFYIDLSSPPNAILRFADFTRTENDIWICKPTGRNQGKGIFLVRSLLDLQQADAENEEKNQQNVQLKKPKKPMNRVIQRCANDANDTCVNIMTSLRIRCSRICLVNKLV